MNLFVTCSVVVCLMAAASAYKCPEDFGHLYRYGQRVNGKWIPSCYMFVRIDLTWIRARENCIKHEGDLVSIETKGENYHLRRIIKQSPQLQKPSLTDYRSWGYWLGGNDLLHERHWRWASTGWKFTYADWSRNQPDNKDSMGRAEHCLELLRNFDWKWNDMYCGEEFQGSICEIRAQ